MGWASYEMDCSNFESQWETHGGISKLAPTPHPVLWARPHIRTSGRLVPGRCPHLASATPGRVRIAMATDGWLQPAPSIGS